MIYWRMINRNLEKSKSVLFSVWLEARIWNLVKYIT